MMFYGISLGFSLYIILTVLLDVGGGYNGIIKLKIL
jgi:hypothetical protein